MGGGGGCTVMRAQGPLGQDLHKSLQQPGIAGGGGRGVRGSFIKRAEVITF